MTHSWWCWCTTVCVIVINIVESHARNILVKANDEGSENFSPDFVNFVKGLDLMVFKTEHKKNNTEYERIRATKNITKSVAYRRLNKINEKIKATQNAAIRDILMMKLVSYYEDKYNVGRTNAYSFPGVVDTRPTTRMSRVPQQKADSVEKNTLMQKSDLLQTTQRTQDTNNGVDENNPEIEEVVVL